VAREKCEKICRMKIEIMLSQRLRQGEMTELERTGHRQHE
jgi:hypothetical protein